MRRLVDLLPLALLLAFSPSVQAGSYGVRNGSLTGWVFGEDSGPLDGVFVVAVRQADPGIIRTCRSGPDGAYRLDDLPLGEYVMGFSRIGFRPLTTEAGEESTQTVTGGRVRVVIESGRNSTVPRVTLEKLPFSGPGRLSARVLDAVTGEAVEHAGLMLGASTAVNEGDGLYSLNAAPSYDEHGAPAPGTLVIYADGYEDLNEQVTVPGGSGVIQTFFLHPRMVTLSGVVDIDPAIDPAEYPNIKVTAGNVPDALSQGKVLDGSGLFELRVPASNRARTRTYDISFRLAAGELASISGIMAPRAGISRIPASVRLSAKTVTAAGQVLTSDGAVPKDDPVSEAVIVELGRSVPVRNGSFTFDAVPIGRALTIKISVRNSETGQIEQADMSFTATGNGDFFLPVCITSPTGG